MFSVVRRTSTFGVRGTAALAYFCLLGAGFMLVEIEFFHVFSLVLGHPTAALAIVLASLLISSGIGSLTADRLTRAGGACIAAGSLVLLGFLGGFLLAKGWILSTLVGLPFGWRVFGTAATIAPLGFCMGLPMPTAARMLEGRPDILLLGWALNGAFSVLAGVTAVFMALHVGIAATFSAGAVCYAVASLLIHVFRDRPSSSSWSRPAASPGGDRPSAVDQPRPVGPVERVMSPRPQ
jgi:hypothetical protein